MPSRERKTATILGPSLLFGLLVLTTPTVMAADSTSVGSAGTPGYSSEPYSTTWSRVSGKPATSTRWPKWSEVTSKPTTATRWPKWSEVTSKPSTFPPSSHNHDSRYVNKSGDSMSGTLNMGGNSISNVNRVTASSFYYSSDARLKENIETIEAPLDILQKLRGVQFDWQTDGSRDMGVIAQELEEVLPFLVAEHEGVDGMSYKTVQLTSLVGPLIEAVKALDEKNRALRADLEDLRERVSDAE